MLSSRATGLAPAVSVSHTPTILRGGLVASWGCRSAPQPHTSSILAAATTPRPEHLFASALAHSSPIVKPNPAVRRRYWSALQSCTRSKKSHSPTISQRFVSTLDRAASGSCSFAIRVWGCCQGVNPKIGWVCGDVGETSTQART